MLEVVMDYLASKNIKTAVLMSGAESSLLI
jgi:hypothetical protein